jgi:hypothetical protein
VTTQLTLKLIFLSLLSTMRYISSDIKCARKVEIKSEDLRVALNDRPKHSVFLINGIY